MAKTFSEKDLELLGYTDTAIMKANGGEPWRIYEAIEDSLGAGATVDNFLYFRSTTKKYHIEICAKNNNYNGYHFIAPASIVDSVRKSFKNVKTVDELIQPRLKQRFSSYTKGIERYIGDRNNTTEDIYIPSELHKTLFQRLSKGESSEKPIHIITADAATGKTTLVRNIVSKIISQKNFITIYIEISQIESLDNYRDFWGLIKPQLGDAFLNETLFKYGLRQGYFIFIFDGFDELCTKRHSCFTANQLLEWFIDIVEDEDAECKIAITTRKSFWESEANTKTLDKYIEIHELEPFNKEQTKSYFKEFFKYDDTSTNINRANSIYTALTRKEEIPFIKLPSSVHLIADSVKNGVRNITQFTNEKPAITQFLLFMLNRENARHKLLTTPELQLSALEDIAVSYFPNQVFEVEDLLVGFTEGENEQSLKHHPFIRNTYANGYKFSFTSLELYFISVYLQSKFNEYINNQVAIADDALNIIESEVKGEGILLDIFMDLLDKKFDFKQAHKNTSNKAKSFLFHVAKRQIKTKMNERETISFFNDLTDVRVKTNTRPTNLITGLYIVGDIVGMDFSNTILQKCTFKNINFKKCRGMNTKFQECEFIGDLEFNNDDNSIDNPMKQFISNWSDIQEENCKFYELSKYAWNNLPVVTSTLDKGNKIELIERTFRAILNQFFNATGYINDVSINKFQDGVLGLSIYTTDIINIMLANNFIEKINRPRGNGTLYQINKDKSACMHRFKEENSMTGGLKALHKTIMQEIKID